MQLDLFTTLLGVVLVGLGIAIWVTASQVLSIIFLVVLLILGGYITGLWGKLFGNKQQ